MNVIGNGDSLPFKIVIPIVVSQQIKVEYIQAKSAGLGVIFREALAAIATKLESNPLEFGEAILDRSTVQFRHGVVRPVFVEFAVHFGRHVVFLRRVAFLSPG